MSCNAKLTAPKAIDQKKRAVSTRPFGREARIVPRNLLFCKALPCLPAAELPVFPGDRLRTVFSGFSGRCGSGALLRASLAPRPPNRTDDLPAADNFYSRHDTASLTSHRPSPISIDRLN